MTLGSPTSPKPASGAQFLPGFLMGDLPAPTTPQPRPFNLTTPIAESTGMHWGHQEDTYLQKDKVVYCVDLLVCPPPLSRRGRWRRLGPAACRPHPQG